MCGNEIQVVAHARTGYHLIPFVGRYGDQQIKRYNAPTVIDDGLIFIVDAFDGEVAFDLDVFFIEQVLEGIE